MLLWFRMSLFITLPQAFMTDQHPAGTRTLNLNAVATLDPQSHLYDDVNKALKGAHPPIPKNAPKNFTVPANQTLQYILVGEGTQNYTCSPVSAKDATLVWGYAGAQAQLRDISSYRGLSRYVSNDLMLGSGVKRVMHYNPQTLKLVGFHYYDTVKDSKGTRIMPAFDFSPSLGFRSEASYVIAEKVSSVPSPSKPAKHIPWQVLKVIKGSFCKTILRTTTRGGWPPNGPCPTADEPLQVDFAAIYWVYK